MNRRRTSRKRRRRAGRCWLLLYLYLFRSCPFFLLVNIYIFYQGGESKGDLVLVCALCLKAKSGQGRRRRRRRTTPQDAARCPRPIGCQLLGGLRHPTCIPALSSICTPPPPPSPLTFSSLFFFQRHQIKGSALPAGSKVNRSNVSTSEAATAAAAACSSKFPWKKISWPNFAAGCLFRHGRRRAQSNLKFLPRTLPPPSSSSPKKVQQQPNCANLFHRFMIASYMMAFALPFFFLSKNIVNCTVAPPPRRDL